MTRLILTLAAFAIAAPAAAAPYSARPANDPTGGRIVTRDIAWTYANGALTGRSDESRPAVICQGLAKRVGRLDRFEVDGRAFGPSELAKCNAFAKDGAATLANAK
jgi:hypothetical protein